MDFASQKLFKRRFLLFTNTIRYRGQRIKNIYEVKLTYIKQTPQFLFKFLKINLGKRTSYYNLYRNIKASVNILRLIDKYRGN